MLASASYCACCVHASLLHAHICSIGTRLEVARDRVCIGYCILVHSSLHGVRFIVSIAIQDLRNMVNVLVGNPVRVQKMKKMFWSLITLSIFYILLAGSIQIQSVRVRALLTPYRPEQLSSSVPCVRTYTIISNVLHECL